MVASAKRATRMTVEEFFAWNPEDGLDYELVDGEPQAKAPGSTIHGYRQAGMGADLRDHLRRTRPRCVVIANPGVVPRFFSRHDCRIRDLAVMAVSRSRWRLRRFMPDRG
jgi:Uma2 family endonuclease